MSVITEKQVRSVLAALKQAKRQNPGAGKFALDYLVGQALGLKQSRVKAIRDAGSWAEYERRKGVRAEKVKTQPKKLTGAKNQRKRAEYDAAMDVGKKVSVTKAKKGTTFTWTQASLPTSTTTLVRLKVKKNAAKVKRLSKKTPAIHSPQPTTKALEDVVKGTHAGPSTTPDIYDTKAAYEHLQNTVNARVDKLSRQTEAALKVGDEQIEKLRKKNQQQDRLIQALVEGHNAEIKVELPKRRWFGRRG